MMYPFVYIYKRKDGQLIPCSSEINHKTQLNYKDYELIGKYKKGKYVSSLKASEVRGKTRYLYDNSGISLVYAEVYGTGKYQRVERNCSPQEWLEFMKKAKFKGE